MTSERKKMFPLFNLDDVVDNSCQRYEDDTISAKDFEVRCYAGFSVHILLNFNCLYLYFKDCSKSEIIACLKFTWEPPLSFAFPVQIEGNRTRKFQDRYLQPFPWLAYSKDKQGAFCKRCVIFITSGGGVGNQSLGKLVKEPKVKYKHALTDLNNHAKTEYHLLAEQRANDFLHNYETGNEKAVNVLLDSRNKQVIEYNRKLLIPIVKTIIFCPQNNLALRGHREIGIECGDSDLLTNLETSNKNYVLNCVIREDFLGFIKMESTTGIVIMTAIQIKLENIGLTFENLRGQGYDGGSNMLGVNNGVKSLILKKQPLVFYTHCLSQCLNLCLSKACNVPAIKNMMGTIQSVSGLFSNSAKKTEKLKSVIESSEI
ncbi:unnamed protein product [Macrosiphum euphorbiae]|uniref:DUF4371 domain-containing protein n=2 Tax=Macrosiphum euphorbiae TaxID=13131 RepID=A0AAV0WDQ3_9HEMI|nr:unnamed protein product [Macrosiphum euphorbiae]